LPRNRFVRTICQFDAVERVLLLLGLLLVAGQADHLLLMLSREITRQCHHTGREFVVDAPAGRAHFFDDTFALKDPSSAHLVVDGAALRADRTIVQLSPMLVRIENVILLRMSCDAARCSRPLRPLVRLFHIGSVRCEIDTV
jgi:hypothetical protein